MDQREYPILMVSFAEDLIEDEITDILKVIKIMTSSSWGYYWNGRSRYGVLRDSSGTYYRIKQIIFERLNKILNPE